MKICTRIHDFGKDTATSLATKAKEAGFDGAQLVINKAIIGETGLPGTLTEEKASAIYQEFHNKNIEIAMLGAYFNPVHSNKDLVQTNILKFKEYLKLANLFDCSYVGTETGSYNDDKWTYHPQNRTEEAYLAVKDVFIDLLSTAKQCGSYIAIEGADGHCMYSPKQLKRLCDEIDNGHLYVIIDVYNFLNIDNYQDHTSIFDECIELFHEKIVIFHLKDFIVKDNKLVQVGLGQGMMNLKYMLPKMQVICPNAYLIFEGVMPVDIDSSIAFVKAQLN